MATQHAPGWILAAATAAALAGCTEPPNEQPAEHAATSAVTSTAGLDTPLLYDAQYYESLYPDLQAAFGTNTTALHNHWLTNGIHEGRRASPIFDCALYLALNPDIAPSFGGDCAAAMTHFRDTGLPVDGRRASIEFDVKYYLATYVDLRNAYGATGYQNAATHFLTFGLWQEGRAGSNEYAGGYYVCSASDLTSAFYGNDRAAAEQWAKDGVPGGRRGSVHFDVHYYLQVNPDVAAAYGTNYAGALQHWLVNGIHEGRTGDPNDGGGASPSCAAGTPVDMHVSATTSATGFPTTWFGFPLPAGQLGYAGLNGTVSVTNSANIYSEVLFIVGYLPSGACQAGQWPATTPEFGPPGFVGVTNLIVKAPTAGTYTSGANFVLPGHPAISSCLMIGLNGGTVAASHSVTSTSNLTLRYTAPPSTTILGGGAEFCFGQNWGCQGATTSNAQSFASVSAIPRAGRLTALFGNISDTTFDGSGTFGAPPAGAWTASNDFYIYHGAECAAVGPGGPTKAGNYYAQIPGDAIHLASVPISGNHISASAVPVFQPLSTPVAPGDCLVTLFGVNAAGGFDNETQVSAILE
ncbi:MAG TPA: hypothetical protein VH165_12160 [Kofleriaceae bacterium]|jgi:hypothetical protein|nr:hypothetical protein [Kofleriaceae bacterium]